MPHEFHEYPFELEPEASSSRSGGPPRKSTAVDVLDPPRSPARPVEPMGSQASSVWMRGLAIAILAGIGLLTLLQLLLKH
jgi:hypothetical protein